MRMRTTRRDFVKTSLAACVSGFAAGPLAQSRPPSIKKGLVFDMVPSNLSYADRFKLVRDTGFQVVEALASANSQAHAAGRAAQSRHRHRGGLEQIPAEPARNGPIHR